jgi:hypothetical protein
MPIIAHICDNVKSYIENGAKTARKMVAEGLFKCDECFNPYKIHSSYTRSVKETGDELEIMVLRCKQRCGRGHALLPDFISPWKQYGMPEIEKVVSGAQAKSVSEIDTAASESTSRRWVAQAATRMLAAVSVIKAQFGAMGAAVSKLALDPRGGFAELESLLDEAPRRVRHSGTTLGLANLWLGAAALPSYI